MKDIQVDTDLEVLFPDDYINNISERLNLYTELNGLKTEEELQNFEAALMDRFGVLPTQAEDLLNSVRIKWIAAQIGIEKLVLKKGRMVGYFIADQQSKFYQSASFTKVLKYVQANTHACEMKEKETRNGLRLLLTFKNINSVEKALKALKPLQ